MKMYKVTKISIEITEIEITRKSESSLWRLWNGKEIMDRLRSEYAIHFESRDEAFNLSTNTDYSIQETKNEFPKLFANKEEVAKEWLSVIDSSRQGINSELLEENESLKKQLSKSNELWQDAEREVQRLQEWKKKHEDSSYGGLLNEYNKLEAINKQLLEALQHAVDLFKELHPPDGVHDCKFYESLIAKSKS